MATITLHVGLPKTGTSSIQGWLQVQRHALAQQGIVLLVATAESARVVVRPHTAGGANSGGIIGLLQDPTAKRQAARDFADQLRGHADTAGHVVVSGEALSQPFWMQDREVLAEWNRLGEHHRCEVIYYLNPQHKALEAAWRQWGFRTGHGPATYVRALSDHFHYWPSLAMRDLAPDLQFRFRPFIRDQLTGRDAVRDFAEAALGVSAEPPEDANVGAPLTVVNLLASTPTGILWDSPHDNARFDRVKSLLQGAVPEEATAVLRGRRVVERWAYDLYRAENEKLMGEFGWPDDGWPRDDGGDERDIAILDELWTPSASAAELAVLHRLLEVAATQTSDS